MFYQFLLLQSQEFTANLSTTDNTVLDNILTKITANETLLTAANIDHAANEALLTGIDSDTDAIKTATEACLQIWQQ